jgi:hypothetical protein
MGIKTSGWQGAKTLVYLDIPSFRNALRRNVHGREGELQAGQIDEYFRGRHGEGSFGTASIRFSLLTGA